MEPEDAGADGPAGGGSFEAVLDTLTGAQRRAVESPAPALCVLAGAGAGKTRVLTLRVGRRIRDGSADPDHTAVCTFTRKAAGELRTRLVRLGVAVSTPAPAGGVPTPGVRSGTIHQLALSLLRRHALDSGSRPPSVVEHRNRIITGLVGEAATAAAIGTEIGWAKARCLTPEEYPHAATATDRAVLVGVDRAARVFSEYQEALARRGALDLDDVLVRASELLDDDDAFAAATRWRYRHLSVDEFQDVNPAQYRLVLTLLGTGDDICVIGDADQAIYGWNGADPRLLSRLPDVLDGMEVVHLDANHRSTAQVVAAAVAALGPSMSRPGRSAVGDGPRPVVTSYESGDDEAADVVRCLMDRFDDGLPWSEQAVLARTHDQLANLGEALARAGVPHHIAPAPEDQGSQVPVASSEPSERSAVELATFHRAKGLEWTSVHVLGLEDGLVPIVYAESAEARAEERRLLYVALTRARSELHCSWARRRRTNSGRVVERQPSPWLAAVARTARVRSGRLTSTVPDAGRRLAELRASLDR